MVWESRESPELHQERPGLAVNYKVVQSSMLALS